MAAIQHVYPTRDVSEFYSEDNMEVLEAFLSLCLQRPLDDMKWRQKVGRIISNWIYDLPSHTSHIWSEAALRAPRNQRTLDHAFGRQYVGQTIYEMAHNGVPITDIMAYLVDQTVVYTVTKKENVLLRNYQNCHYDSHAAVYKAAGMKMVEGKPIYQIGGVAYHLPRAQVARILGINEQTVIKRCKSTKFPNYKVILP